MELHDFQNRRQHVTVVPHTRAGKWRGRVFASIGQFVAQAAKKRTYKPIKILADLA